MNELKQIWTMDIPLDISHKWGQVINYWNTHISITIRAIPHTTHVWLDRWMGMFVFTCFAPNIYALFMHSPINMGMIERVHFLWWFIFFLSVFCESGDITTWYADEVILNKGLYVAWWYLMRVDYGNFPTIWTFIITKLGFTTKKCFETQRVKSC